MIRFTSYGVIAEKPRVGHCLNFFRAPCRKNYGLDRKLIDTFLLYHHAKSGEDRTTLAGCRCENVVFFSIYRQDCAKRTLPVLNLLTGRK